MPCLAKPEVGLFWPLQAFKNGHNLLPTPLSWGKQLCSRQETTSPLSCVAKKGITLHLSCWGDSTDLQRRQDGTDGSVCDLAQLKQKASFCSHHSGSHPGLSAGCNPEGGCCCDLKAKEETQQWQLRSRSICDGGALATVLDRWDHEVALPKWCILLMQYYHSINNGANRKQLHL